jgi:hypothetical protein
MNENRNRSEKPKNQKAMRRLEQELAGIASASAPVSVADNEMLSLIVNDVLKGVDIAARYPTFYQELLKNSNLRQAFLEALESLEKGAEPVALPQASKTSLAFLTSCLPQAVPERLAGGGWKIGLQRTIEQLQSIFSPPKLAYRSDPSLSEDPWFTLIREEFDVEEAQYAIVLECTLSEDDAKALSADLNFAVTIRAEKDRPRFPIQATLQWGTYHEMIQITEEGRTRFPNIPLSSVFDDEHLNVQADIQLSLQNIS